MFKRKILTLCLGLSVLAAGSVIAQIAGRENQKDDSASSSTGLMKRPDGLQENRERKPKNDTDSEGIPEEIVYGQMFRHIEELNKKADEEESKGKNGKGLRGLYKEKANLNEKQSVTLDNTAKDVNARLFEVDSKAKQLIEQVRAKHPDGKLQAGEAPPEPPQELYDLSNQRKEILSQGIKTLRENFGPSEFAKFGEFVNKEVKTGIKMRMGSKRNSEEEN